MENKYNELVLSKETITTIEKCLLEHHLENLEATSQKEFFKVLSISKNIKILLRRYM